MARRKEVEIFGLSMLDTVTCGLGGGIVIMLFLASQIPPGAKINFKNETAADAASDENTRLTTIGALTVFFEYHNAVDPNSTLPETCDGSHLEIMRTSILRHGDVFGDPLKHQRRYGSAVWWAVDTDKIPIAGQCIRVEPAGSCDTYFYVAGAHQSTPADCSDTLCFTYSEDEGVYVKDSCPP